MSGNSKDHQTIEERKRNLRLRLLPPTLNYHLTTYRHPFFAERLIAACEAGQPSRQIGIGCLRLDDVVECALLYPATAPSILEYLIKHRKFNEFVLAFLAYTDDSHPPILRERAAQALLHRIDAYPGGWIHFLKRYTRAPPPPSTTFFSASRVATLGTEAKERPNSETVVDKAPPGSETLLNKAPPGSETLVGKAPPELETLIETGRRVLRLREYGLKEEKLEYMPGWYRHYALMAQSLDTNGELCLDLQILVLCYVFPARPSEMYALLQSRSCDPQADDGTT